MRFIYTLYSTYLFEASHNIGIRNPVSFIFKLVNDMEIPVDAGKLSNERMNNFPSQLFGEEQQRVSIARALSKNPQIVLCDEPTGALDSETGRMVLGLIHDVSHDLEKTVIIVTHNTPIAEMAQTVIHMRDGKINEIKQNSNPKNEEEIEW